MTDHEPISDPRLAGDVKRWHVVTTNRQQTVAEHSWNVARILLAIWPDCPREVVIEALFHDCGEIETGDPPSTLKNRDDRLGPVYKQIENDVRLSMCLPWGLPPPHEMYGYEKQVLRMADMIEMLEFSLREEMLGNRFFAPVSERLRMWITVTLGALPNDAPVRGRIKEYLVRRELTWLGGQNSD